MGMLRDLHRMIRKATLHGGIADDPRARGDGPLHTGRACHPTMTGMRLEGSSSRQLKVLNQILRLHISTRGEEDSRI